MAVIGLLGMLCTALGAMDGAATAAHHEAVFSFLLRALDLRRQRPASLLRPAGDGAAAAETVAEEAAAGQQAQQGQQGQQGQLDEVEAAAVAAFVALTLKLSEGQFKPLFLRLLDWAGSAPPGAGAAEAGAARVARGIALAALANALAERLRSVFVPYFRYLLDPFLAALSGAQGGLGVGSPSRPDLSLRMRGPQEQPCLALAASCFPTLAACHASCFLTRRMLLAPPADGAAATPAKGKKKKKAKKAEAGSIDPSDPVAVADDWRLRLQASRPSARAALCPAFLKQPSLQSMLAARCCTPRPAWGWCLRPCLAV